MSGEQGKYICAMPDCGWIFDPAEGDPGHGVPPGTAFEDLPEDWRCPVCGASIKAFVPYEG